MGSGEELGVSTGTTTTSYAYSPAGPLAQKVGTSFAQVMLTDLHTDVVGLIQVGSSASSDQAYYSAWGERSGATSALGMQAQLTDPLTGQVDMGARNYEPTLGRFSSRDVLFGDPTSPMSLNQFVYATDSPITFTDPTGMLPYRPGYHRPRHPADDAGDVSVETPTASWPDPPIANARVWARLIDLVLSWERRIEILSNYIQNNPEYGRDPLRAWTDYEESAILGHDVSLGGWNETRAERNYAVTKAAAAIALPLLLLSGGSCDSRGAAGLRVCYDVPAIKLSIGGLMIDTSGGLTVGDIYLDPDDKASAPTLAHERRHSDWYAIMGPEEFIAEYLRERAADPRGQGCVFLEYAAGYQAGGYEHCPV